MNILKDHLHFIDGRDGDKVCVDILRWDGCIWGLSWYSLLDPLGSSVELWRMVEVHNGRLIPDRKLYPRAASPTAAPLG
jgi:hypothetical protein